MSRCLPCLVERYPNKKCQGSNEKVRKLDGLDECKKILREPCDRVACGVCDMCTACRHYFLDGNILIRNFSILIFLV